MRAHVVLGWVLGLAVTAAGCTVAETPPLRRGAGPVVIGDGGAPEQDAGVDDDGQDDDPADDAPTFAGPRWLSETGLYTDITRGVLADGVIAYDVRYPVWTDGSQKRRFLWLPPGTKIDTSDMNDWVFPVGTKAWQELSADGLRLDTRFAEKVADGVLGWQRVAYVWNDHESDAEAALEGQVDIRGTTHDADPPELCITCHRGARDGLNGVAAIQLSTAEPGGSLDELIQLGLFSDPPDRGFEVPGEGVVKEALGYLHGNCGHCHGDGHFLAEIRLMRLQLKVENQTPEDTPTYRTSFGIVTNHVMYGTTVVISPGAPEESQLYVRMRTDDLFFRMPFSGTEVVDDDSVDLIREWIVRLEP